MRSYFAYFWIIILLFIEASAITPPKKGVKAPENFEQFLRIIGQSYKSGGLYHAIQDRKLGTRLTQVSVILPVVLGGYSDGPFGFYSKFQFQDSLFNNNPSGAMSDYYAEVSYGQFSVTGTVYGWFYLLQSQSFYVGSDNGLSGGGARFCYDLAALTDISIDYSQFDNDGPDGIPNSGDDDGYVDAFVGVHTGGGAETGDNDNLWSHRWSFKEAYLSNPAIMPDSVYITNDPSTNGGFIKINDYIVAPETNGDGTYGEPMAKIGVYCHEFGHILGLPDLYDTDTTNGNSEGIGVWGLMGSGSYGSADYSHPESPTHLCAWSKVFLGWITSIPVSENIPYAQIQNVENNPQVYRLWTDGNIGSEYFLVENRFKTGFDTYLPNSGLCIWHIDESVIAANIDSNTVNADENHKGVDLEEADGLNDLDNNINNGDDGDVFPGNFQNTVFDSVSNPNSDSYSGNNTNVEVLVYGGASSTMFASLNVNSSNTPALTNLVSAEYFFDNDPGFGNGIPIPISPDTIINVNLNVDVSGLAPGLHKVYFRVKDEDGVWGIAQPRLFLVQPTNRDTPNPNLTEAEYFFDADPGFSNGTAFTVTPDDSINVTTNVDVSVLSPGLHKLFIRTRDATGLWSLAQPRLAMIQTTNRDTPNPDITEAEYFFDNDPGFGSGSTFSVTPSDTIDVTANVDVSPLSPGLHKLFIRARDANGLWSLAQSRLAMIQTTNRNTSLPLLTEAEYFFDNDPGFGNGGDFTFTPDDTISVNALLSISGMPGGVHRFYVRVRDELGLWSLAQNDTFFVEDAAIIYTSQDSLSYQTLTTDSSLILDTLFIYNLGNLDLVWSITTDSISGAISNPGKLSIIGHGESTFLKEWSSAGKRSTNKFLLDERGEADESSIPYPVTRNSGLNNKRIETPTTNPLIPCPWLTASPGSGLTSPGDSTLLLLMIDPVGLPGNITYRCNIEIASNDPNTPVLTVPVELNVILVNHPPVINEPLPELFFAEDDTLSYAISNWYAFVTDPDQPVDQLSYLVLPGSNVTTQQVGNDYQFNAAANWFGRDTLQLVVSDGLASDTASLYVNVSSVNDPPVVTAIPPIVFPEDSSYSFDLDPYVADVDHDTTEISWSASFPAGLLNALQGRFGQQDASRTALVTPVQTAVAEEATGGGIGRSGKLSGGAPALRIVYHKYDRRSAAVLKQSRKAVEQRAEGRQLTHPPMAAGLLYGNSDSLMIVIDSVSHVATITATPNFYGLDIPVIFTAVDDSGAAGWDTTTITVQPVNDPPVITEPLPELFFAEDDTLSYAISDWYAFVTDPDQPVDQLSYLVLPGSNVTAQQVGNNYQFIAAANWFGRDTLQLVVSDNIAADTAALYVNVSSVNDPPIISNLPDSVSFPADSSTTLNIWDYVEDVETPDSLLQYQFAASNDSLLRSYNVAAGELTLSAVLQFHGAVMLTVTVSDDSSAAAEDSLLVIVEPVTGIDPFAGKIPDDYVLFQNYPNPFNPSTRIRFGLPKASMVTLEVFNILGQRVITLINGKQLTAGYHVMQFDGSHLASGLYLYRFQAERFTQVRKMLLMK